MKKLILIILVVIFLSYGNTNEIIFDGSGKAEISGFTFSDTSSYKLFRSNGHWKSSTGDYGLHKCLGTVTTNKNNKNGFNVYCKYISQKDDYFIFGSETKGISEEILKNHWENTCVIPIENKKIRSLNLANSVGIVLFEAIRQINA